MYTLNSNSKTHEGSVDSPHTIVCEAADVEPNVHSECSDKACPICRPLTVVLSRNKDSSICDECVQPLDTHIDCKCPDAKPNERSIKLSNFAADFFEAMAKCDDLPVTVSVDNMLEYYIETEIAVYEDEIQTLTITPEGMVYLVRLRDFRERQQMTA